MNKSHIEEKEIVKINNQEYTVITRIIENARSKESLIKLIVEYAMQDLKQDNL